MNVKLTDLMGAGDAGEAISLTAKDMKQGNKIGKPFGTPDLSAPEGLSAMPDFQMQLHHQMKMGSEIDNKGLEQAMPQKQVAILKQPFEGIELFTDGDGERPRFPKAPLKDGGDSTINQRKKTFGGAPNQAAVSDAVGAPTPAPVTAGNETKMPLLTAMKGIPLAKQVHDETANLPVKAREKNAPVDSEPNIDKAPSSDRPNDLAFLTHSPATTPIAKPTTKPGTLNEKSRDDREINIELSNAVSANPRPISPEMAPVSTSSSSAPTTFVEPSKEVAQLVSTLPPQATEDASLRAAVHPNVANISIDTGEAGALSVRLMVKDGVADVQLKGPAAPVIENRESELRVVLAQEGLSLGQFDSPQRDNSQQRFDRDELPTRPSSPATSQTTTRAAESPPSANNGRVHIKA